MTVYYFLIMISAFIYMTKPKCFDCYICMNNVFRYGKKGRSEKYKIRLTSKFFIVTFLAVIIFFVMAFRDFSVGADTSRYVIIFNEHLYGEGKNALTARTDWLYTYFNNFCSMFLSARLYVMLLSLIFVASIVKLGITESDNPFLFLFFYITIGTFSMNMSGIRQSLAMSLAIFAYYLAKKKRVVLFFIIIGIAFLFHNSAIIFLIVYPVLSLNKNGNRNEIFFWTMAPVLGFLPFIPTIVIATVKSLNLYKFIPYLGATGINLKCFIFYYGLLCIITILNLLERKTIAQKDISLFKMSVLGCLCYGMAPNFYLFDRLALYFTPFMIAYYVNSLLKLKKYNLRKTAIMMCMMISVVWFVFSTINGSLSIDHYSFGL